MIEQKNIIVGPCAVESREQIINIASELKDRGILSIRTDFWKPRTKPGWDGIHEAGIPWAREIIEMGLTVATEVMFPNHVLSLADQLGNNDSQVITWIGSRNQNHIIQEEIAKAVHDLMPKTILMIKNPPWPDIEQWLGIIDHVTSAGFPPNMLLLCHRGFFPGKESNPRKLRNLPDWDMAMTMKEQTGLPMIVDPSHIGGSPNNVLEIVNEALKYSIDGLLVEVHPNPESAKTDGKQQLSLEQFDKLLRKVRGKVIGDEIKKLTNNEEINHDLNLSQDIDHTTSYL